MKGTKAFCCSMLLCAIAIWALPLASWAQQTVKVTGTVMDEAGKPLVAASVHMLNNPI